MTSADQVAQTRSRMPLIVVILGLVVVMAVILWDHLPLPSGPHEPSRVRAPSAGASAGLDALFAALGMHRPTEPSAAPDFTLMTFAGRPAQLREFRGKLVLLNFWATWCAPCLQEMPSMERLYQTFKQTEFVLLAVSMDRQGVEVAKTVCGQLETHLPGLTGHHLGSGPPVRRARLTHHLPHRS